MSRNLQTKQTSEAISKNLTHTKAISSLAISTFSFPFLKLSLFVSASQPSDIHFHVEFFLFQTVPVLLTFHNHPHFTRFTFALKSSGWGEAFLIFGVLVSVSRSMSWTQREKYTGKKKVVHIVGTEVRCDRIFPKPVYRFLSYRFAMFVAFGIFAFSYDREFPFSSFAVFPFFCIAQQNNRLLQKVSETKRRRGKIHTEV